MDEVDGNVECTPEAITAYLDGAIRQWRTRRDEAAPDSADNLMAICYVDAFQSVRMSLFGETLPVES